MIKIVQGDKLELSQMVPVNASVLMPTAVSIGRAVSLDLPTLALKLRQNTRP